MDDRTLLAIVAVTEPQTARSEGCILTAYPDPSSPLAVKLRQIGIANTHYKSWFAWKTLSGAPWSIGYGHTGPDVCEGVVWSQEQADNALRSDLTGTAQRLAAGLSWWINLDVVRAGVLLDIAFNVGVSGLEHWPTTLSHVASGHYTQAAIDLLNEGKWNRDVGDRAKRLSDAMRTGCWPA